MPYASKACLCLLLIHLLRCKFHCNQTANVNQGTASFSLIYTCMKFTLVTLLQWRMEENDNIRKGEEGRWGVAVEEVSLVAGKDKRDDW